jgi:hypothetical protein
VLTVGDYRAEAVKGAGGAVLFQPGEIPVTIKAEDVKFNPVPVFGLACACVKGIPVDDFGPGISGTGVMGCGTQGLTDVDFKVVQDHDTTPGSPGNGGSASGLPDDPECDDTSSSGPFINSTACLEGTGANCSTENNSHLGKCNSPRVVTFSGGQAARGAVLLVNSSSIGLLQDGARCDLNKPMRNGKCEFADYGPDCTPCTDDDLEKGTPNIAPTTSGTAQVEVYDVNDTAGDNIVEGQTCGGATACVTKVTGSESTATPSSPIPTHRCTALWRRHSRRSTPPWSVTRSSPPCLAAEQ